MLSLQWIRENPELFDKGLERRGEHSFSAHIILELDQRYRSIKSHLQGLREKRNMLADEVGKCKRAGVSCELLLQQAEQLKASEEITARDEAVIKDQLDALLSKIPNHLAEGVPSGQSEKENKEVRRWGEPVQLETMKDHVELGKSFGGLDLEQAAIVSGSRFFFLRGELARLERALAGWMLDLHVREHGFEEVAVPYLVREKSAFGSGNLPKFAEDLFRTSDGRYLIPTAEMALVNWAADRIMLPQELPLRLVAYSPCFRSEAGSAGKDTHGIFRVHQFTKVELVTICLPEDSEKEHAHITASAEKVLQELGLAYRVVELCAGDTGFSSSKTYDVEVWMPSQQSYREISSCSNCLDFQARRMNARYRREKDKDKDKEKDRDKDKGSDKGGLGYVHTLNGSGIAITRCLIAVMENYQLPDGSIRVPEVLVPYMGGKKCIGGGK